MVKAYNVITKKRERKKVDLRVKEEGKKTVERLKSKILLEEQEQPMKARKIAITTYVSLDNRASSLSPVQIIRGGPSLKPKTLRSADVKLRISMMPTKEHKAHALQLKVKKRAFEIKSISVLKIPEISESAIGRDFELKPKPLEKLRVNHTRRKRLRAILELQAVRKHIQIKRLTLGRISEPAVTSPRINLTIKTLKPRAIHVPPDLTTRDLCVKEVEAKGAGEGELPPDLLHKLFPKLSAKSLSDVSFRKPLCVLAIGDKLDGLDMLTNILSYKYTYHGEYRFSMSLPLQNFSELKGEARIRGLSGEGTVKNIYELITSGELIVRESVSEKDLPDIERALKEIAKRGPKCVILYTKDIKPFEDLHVKVPDVDFLVVSLPKLEENTIRIIEDIIGVKIPGGAIRSVDEAWGRGLRIQEEELSRLDEKLNIPGVEWNPEEETWLHFLMKKITFYWLREKGRQYIEVEVTLPSGKRADLKANDEYWEVETGYPTKDEKAKLKEPWDPAARLISKLSKYSRGSKVRLVVWPIYAYLFRKELIYVKRYYKTTRDVDIKVFTIHLDGEGRIHLRPFI